jgi:hypothetical protein
MSLTINAALAVTFTWTSGGTDLALTFASGTSPVNVTLATGSYRVCLAPTSGDVKDVLRALQSAINTALSGAGRAETFTVALNAAGKVVITGSAPWQCAFASYALARILGFPTSTVAAVTTITGTHQPWYIGYATGAWGGRWAATRAVAGERTSAGRVYSFGASSWAYGRTWNLDLVPQTPEDATAYESYGTPWHPSRAYWTSLGQTSTARAWSWLDLVSVAANAKVAFTDDWPRVSASTSELYDVGYLGAEALGAPEESPIDETWPVYRQAKLPLVLPTSDNSGTRA